VLHYEAICDAWDFRNRAFGNFGNGARKRASSRSSERGQPTGIG
jgi:hypothetical protein